MRPPWPRESCRRRVGRQRRRSSVRIRRRRRRRHRCRRRRRRRRWPHRCHLPSPPPHSSCCRRLPSLPQPRPRPRRPSRRSPPSPSPLSSAGCLRCSCQTARRGTSTSRAGCRTSAPRPARRPGSLTRRRGRRRRRGRQARGRALPTSSCSEMSGSARARWSAGCGSPPGPAQPPTLRRRGCRAHTSASVWNSPFSPKASTPGGSKDTNCALKRSPTATAPPVCAHTRHGVPPGGLEVTHQGFIRRLPQSGLCSVAPSARTAGPMHSSRHAATCSRCFTKTCNRRH
mmetsp:Transcript_42573/g.137453  ORF Transcript_42573/g.137453 Transcript_42573/m.137453 type:complete len:286 (-) Transcript_42573:673-1530(-)